MMRGVVRADEVHLKLNVFRAAVTDAEPQNFVVDTGFTGFLSLPMEQVQALDLPFVDEIEVALADDSTVKVPVYGATIEWHGIARDVTVIATGARALIGTLLLAGSDLAARFLEGGAVLVTPIE